jgi:hypothetical protein
LSTNKLVKSNFIQILAYLSLRPGHPKVVEPKNSRPAPPDNDAPGEEESIPKGGHPLIRVRLGLKQPEVNGNKQAAITACYLTIASIWPSLVEYSLSYCDHLKFCKYV